MSMILPRRPLLLGAASILAGAAERAPVSAIPVSRLDTPWWRIRHQEKLAELRARRCTGCQLDINAADLRVYAAAADDEVLRCEECSRILVRTAQSGL